jgi:hypothetical protein
MQTDPSEGRNQLRSEKVSAYRNSTLDQRYLSENPTNQHQTAHESLQDPSATGRHGGDIEIDEFEVDDNFGDKSQWAEQRAVSLKLPLQKIDTVRELNPRPLLHDSEPLTARPTNMVTTLGADYDSPKRQSETADRFNFSQVENFSSGTEEGIRVPLYLPDSPRFSPIDPQSESMCLSNHPIAVQEFIRTNNYQQDVADLLGPPHYNRVGKLTVQHNRRAKELSWESLEVHGFNTSSVRGDESNPPAGEVFAVITPGEEPLQVRPDRCCLPSGTQRVRIGDINDGNTDRSGICHIL